MSNKKYQNCITCNAVFVDLSSDKCHYCKLIKSNLIKNKPHSNCTSHLSKEDKENVANFILNKKGTLFKFYNEAPQVIKDQLGLDLNFKAVRSIISSEYYKSIAFE